MKMFFATFDFPAKGKALPTISNARILRTNCSKTGISKF